MALPNTPQMDDAYDFDLFVVGGGSGGVRAARRAAELGAKVALAEQDRLGGTCVNLGCIPKKLLMYASEFSRDLGDAAAYGWSVAPARHEWRTLVDNVDLEILRLNAIYQQLLERVGVSILRGRAELMGGHAVSVDGRTYTARYILVATGGAPRLPQIPGREHAITSNEAFSLPARPERVAIAGGGYIGVEFASIFHGLGSQVHLIHRGRQLLGGFDGDVRAHLTHELGHEGIALRLGQHIQAIEKNTRELRVTLSSGEHLEVDQVLLALGRAPRVRGFGLERLGVVLDEHEAIQVDAYSRSSVPHVYAVGDVTGRIALTPVALAEGKAVAMTLFGGKPTPVDHTDVATAVFSHPSVGCVGLNEEQARELFANVVIYKSQFRALKHSLTKREKRTFMKLVVDGDSDRVLGLHMVGDYAGEIVQGFAVAIKLGATKADFDHTVGVHPTAAEEFVTMRG